MQDDVILVPEGQTEQPQDAGHHESDYARFLRELALIGPHSTTPQSTLPSSQPREIPTETLFPGPSVAPGPFSLEGYEGRSDLANDISGSPPKFLQGSGHPPSAFSEPVAYGQYGEKRKAPPAGLAKADLKKPKRTAKGRKGKAKDSAPKELQFVPYKLPVYPASPPKAKVVSGVRYNWPTASDDPGPRYVSSIEKSKLNF